MDCQEVQSLLSAYHDGELSAELRPAVAEHIGGCSRCGEELAVFECLSGMSKRLVAPEPPEGVWAGIEAALDADLADAPGGRSAIQRGRPGKEWRPGFLVVAALVLIAAGVVWIATSWHSPGHHGELAADFEHYLEHFTSDPEGAQNILLAKYAGKSIDLAEAETLVGYRPAVAAGLPEGYAMDATYVLKMPCCTCVQTICRREDGRVFAIFEHSENQAVWCGDRSSDRVECNGRPCTLTQVQNTLLATWKSRQRQLTIVGVQSVEEIGNLMAHFDAEATKI